MAWLIQTFCKILLGACADIFALFADDFISNFGINIGASFPTIKTQLKGTSVSLYKILADYPSKGGTSAFDTFFPVNSFKPAFVAFALALATGLLIKELVQAIGSPLMSGRKQRPIISVLRYLGSVVTIVSSYRIFIIMEYVMNTFYIAFAKISVISLGRMNGPVGSQAINTMTDSTKGMYQAFLFGLATGNMTESVGQLAISTLATSIMSLVVTWLLLISYIRLIIEIVERYVVLGMMFYTAPLPFASLVSEGTSDIFKAWIRMVFSEMLLIVTNSMFLGVFIGAIRTASAMFHINIGTSAAEIRPGITTPFSWLVMMFMLIAWLQMAQNFDAYLKGLGLATAQTGRGVAAAAVAGFTYMTGKAGSKAVKTAANTAVGKGLKAAWGAGGVAGVASAVKGLSADGKAGMDSATKQTAMKSALQGAGFSGLADTLFGGKTASAEGGMDLADSKNKLRDFGSATGLTSPSFNKMVDDAKAVKWDGKGGVAITNPDGSVNKLSVADGASGSKTIGNISSAGGKNMGSVHSSIESETPNSTAQQNALNIAGEAGDRQLTADAKNFARSASKAFDGDYKVSDIAKDGRIQIDDSNGVGPSYIGVPNSIASNYGTPEVQMGDTSFYPAGSRPYNLSDSAHSILSSNDKLKGVGNMLYESTGGTVNTGSAADFKTCKNNLSALNTACGGNKKFENVLNGAESISWGGSSDPGRFTIKNGNAIHSYCLASPAETVGKGSYYGTLKDANGAAAAKLASGSVSELGFLPSSLINAREAVAATGGWDASLLNASSGGAVSDGNATLSFPDGSSLNISNSYGGLPMGDGSYLNVSGAGTMASAAATDYANNNLDANTAGQMIAETAAESLSSPEREWKIESASDGIYKLSADGYKDFYICRNDIAENIDLPEDGSWVNLDSLGPKNDDNWKQAKRMFAALTTEKKLF